MSTHAHSRFKLVQPPYCKRDSHCINSALTCLKLGCLVLVTTTTASRQEMKGPQDQRTRRPKDQRTRGTYSGLFFDPVFYAWGFTQRKGLLHHQAPGNRAGVLADHSAYLSQFRYR